MKRLLAITFATLCCGAPVAQAHTCHAVAPNEHNVADNTPCWRASEMAFGAREQLTKVHWHGQDFELYGFWCKAVNTFDTNGERYISTWHFNCERSRQYINFSWKFLQ